jgi:hypothetical protein
MTNVEHRNPLWRYEDARGVEHRGHYERSVDRGGTDVSYYFRDCETGALSVVSGAALSRAGRVWEPCPHAHMAPHTAVPGNEVSNVWD